MTYEHKYISSQRQQIISFLLNYLKITLLYLQI